jgi:hypothetical protein
MMNRREALKVTSGLLGVAIIGSELFLAGCRPDQNSGILISDADLALLDEVGETILPATDKSPGAKAAAIGRFMQSIVTDCYTDEEQQTFLKGIATLKEKARQEYGGEFQALSGEDRFKMLLELDKQAALAKTSGNLHYFSMIKQLTLWGYFTSEPGATRALRYNPVPGEFIGCIPYKAGDKAWAQ